MDNTLICYDELFIDLAIAGGLVPRGFRGSKRDVRDRIRLQPGGELAWRRLQAEAYGPAIAGARPAQGALAFIRAARADRADVAIVSHKTAHSDLPGETFDLHAAARSWLATHGFIGDDTVDASAVYFEPTREKKILRIGAIGCTCFIDDLEEVLRDPMFPPNVARMLYAVQRPASNVPYTAYASFDEIARAFAG